MPSGVSAVIVQLGASYALCRLWRGKGVEAVNILLERLAGVAARRHWIFIIAWVIILGGLLAAKNAFGGEYVNNYTISGSDSAAGLDVLNKTFPQQGGYGGQIVFHARSGKVSAQESAVNQSVSNVSKLPDVIKAVSPFASSKHRRRVQGRHDRVRQRRLEREPELAGHLLPGQAQQRGGPRHEGRPSGCVRRGRGRDRPEDQRHQVRGDRAGLRTGAAADHVLVADGGRDPAGVCHLQRASGLALLALLARVVTFPTTAPTIATLLGLGVAVDYGLFMVARHREQVDSGMGVLPSVRRAAGTSGAAIVVAGSTVAVSVLGLYISGVGFRRRARPGRGARRRGHHDLGADPGARLHGAGPGGRARPVGAGPGPQGGADRAAAGGGHRRGHARAARAQRVRPVGADGERPSLAVGGGERGGAPGAGDPAVLNHAGPAGQRDEPQSESNRQAYDLISQGFGVGANGPLTVVVKLPNQSSSANSSLLTAMQSDISKTAGVASVTPAAINSSGATAVFNVIPATRPQATQTTALVNTLRDDVLPKEHATSYVTGTTAGAVDFTSQITSRLAWLIIAVVAISFLLLTTAFRSVVIATKAAILNILSIGAAYGVIVAIFEWGWAKSVIGLQSTLPVPAYVPMLVFCIVFGLSMDYEVFLLSRVHEAWLDTRDAHRAVAIGIGATARVITTAAAIMIVVFTSFVLNPDPTVKMLAIGMAFAVLIDASLVRMCLVPSIMSLLGSHAWWLPRWLEPVVPKIQLEGSVAEPAEHQSMSGRHAAPRWAALARGWRES